MPLYAIDASSRKRLQSTSESSSPSVEDNFASWLPVPPPLHYDPTVTRQDDSDEVLRQQQLFPNKRTNYIRAISSGEFHSMILMRDGSVYAIGSHKHGRLGIKGIQSSSGGGEEINQDEVSVSQPRLVHAFSPLSTTTTKTSTATTTTAVSTSTTEMMETTNENGNDAGIVVEVTPKTVSPAKYVVRIVQVNCGGYHSVFLDDEGCVYTCGNTESGECGFLSQNAPSAHLEEPCKWDQPEHSTIIGRVKKIQAGGHTTIVLTNTGEVWTCGKNVYHQCGRMPSQQTLTAPGKVSFDHLGSDIDIDDIESGYYHTICWVKPRGRKLQRLFAFGELTRSRIKHEIPFEISLPFTQPIYQISAGVYNTLLLLENGTSYSISNLSNAEKDQSRLLIVGVEAAKNSQSPYSVVRSFVNERQIAYLSCGYYHSAVLMVDGRVVLYNAKGITNVSLDGRCALVSSGHASTIAATVDLCDGIPQNPTTLAVQLNLRSMVDSDRFSDLVLVTTN